MGRFNASKREASREKHDKKKEGSKNHGSHLDGIKKSMGVICNFCKQPFVNSVKEPQLRKHAEDHGKTFEVCFPEFAKEGEEVLE
jgi:hypothetical protein